MALDLLVLQGKWRSESKFWLRGQDKNELLKMLYIQISYSGDPRLS